MPAIAPDMPKPKRRWLQFRLRTLFILVAVVAVTCWWPASKMKQKRQERLAIAELERLGGFVQYDWQANWVRDGSNIPEPTGPNWLRSILGDNFFSHVVFVHLPPDRHVFEAKYKGDEGEWDWPFTNGPAAHDDDLRLVATLSNLTNLSLRKADIGDAGLAYLRGLTSLDFLDVSGTNITDEALNTVATMTDLNSLHLNRTDIGDVGLARISNLTKMQYLHLRNTKVTDVGLRHLQGMTKLELLNLYGTQVTDESVARLQKHLPNCEIHQ